jgi:hypothetical protein
VEFGITIVTYAKAAKLMQPTNRALDRPSFRTQSAAVGCVAFCQHRFDFLGPQLLTMWFRIVSPVALDTIGPLAWLPWFAADARNLLNQRQQLRDVVFVRPRYRGCEGNPLGIGDDMVLAAELAAIGRIAARFFPPCTARTELESIRARDQLILSAPCKRASNVWCSLSQTPRRCQARNRRQAVMPQPQPSSWGSNSQGIPVFSTNKIADNVSRLPTGFRPGYRRRRFFGGGNTGSITAHNSSSKIGFAMLAPPCAGESIAVDCKC